MPFKKSFLYNLLILLVSILFSFYLIEFFLLITSKERKVHDKYDYFLKLQKNNKEVIPYITTNLLDVNFKKIPENYYVSTISNSEIFWCNQNDYWPHIKTDRYGFNNEDSVWENKIIDNVFLGDSYLFGSCVYKKYNIVSTFSKFNEKNKNINLGFPGSSPIFEYIKLREYVENLIIPKNVIWVFYEGNDLIDLNRNIDKYGNTYLFQYLSDESFTQDLVLNNQIKDNYLKNNLSKVINLHKKNKAGRKVNKIIYKYKFTNFLTLTKIRLIFKVANLKKTKINEKALIKFKEILEKSKKSTKKMNSNLYFVYLPSIYRYKDDFLNKNSDKELDKHFYYNEILKMVRELNIPIIDIKVNVFDKEKDPLSLFPGRLHHHYTERGYSKVGKYIYNYIYK